MTASSLAEVAVHEPAIGAVEPRNAVEDVAPEIVVVALFDDPAVVAEGEFRAAVDWRTGPVPELHLHFPLQEDVAALHHDRADVHVDLLAAPGEAGAQCLERLDAFDALDAILEDDILVVVGEDVRPVGLALAIVGLRPEFAHKVGGEGFDIGFVFRYSRVVHGNLKFDSVAPSFGCLDPR